MLNYIEIINVCKICNKGFNKQGCEVENPDDYEVDLFICSKCKKHINREIDKSLFGKIKLTPIEKSIKRQFNKNKILKRKINKYFRGKI